MKNVPTKMRRRPFSVSITVLSGAAALMVSACSYGALPNTQAAGSTVTAESTAQSGESAGTVLPNIDGAVCCVAVSSGAPTAVGGISTTYNGWDTAFISWMVPHFAVASQLAELAPTRASSAEVKKLASTIDATLAPNYLTMSAMAKAWGQPTPSTDPNAGGHDHGGTDGSGADNAVTLTKIKGVAFDRKYLAIVIADDQAAVVVARNTVENCTNPQAKKLAQQLLEDSTKQVEQAQLLLKKAT